MVQVQQRYLTILLPHDEEDGVREFRQFRNVVPPAQIRHLST